MGNHTVSSFPVTLPHAKGEDCGSECTDEQGKSVRKGRKRKGKDLFRLGSIDMQLCLLNLEGERQRGGKGEGSMAMAMAMAMNAVRRIGGWGVG
jgi:hypothetical protein